MRCLVCVSFDWMIHFEIYNRIETDASGFFLSPGRGLRLEAAGQGIGRVAA